MINAIPVLQSEIQDKLIYYTLPENHGFSKVRCGGTHVKSTAAVGAITLKHVNVGGGKERIEIRLVSDLP